MKKKLIAGLVGLALNAPLACFATTVPMDGQVTLAGDNSPEAGYNQYRYEIYDASGALVKTYSGQSPTVDIDADGLLANKTYTVKYIASNGADDLESETKTFSTETADAEALWTTFLGTFGSSYEMGNDTSNWTSLELGGDDDSFTSLPSAEFPTSDGSLPNGISILVDGATNLNALSSITSAGNYIYIESGTVTDLSGLRNLTTAAGVEIYLEDDVDLSGLSGITALDYIDLGFNSASKRIPGDSWLCQPEATGKFGDMSQVDSCEPSAEAQEWESFVLSNGGSFSSQTAEIPPVFTEFPATPYPYKSIESFNVGADFVANSGDYDLMTTSLSSIEAVLDRFRIFIHANLDAAGLSGLQVAKRIDLYSSGGSISNVNLSSLTALDHIEVVANMSGESIGPVDLSGLSSSYSGGDVNIVLDGDMNPVNLNVNNAAVVASGDGFRLEMNNNDSLTNLDFASSWQAKSLKFAYAPNLTDISGVAGKDFPSYLKIQNTGVSDLSPFAGQTNTIYNLFLELNPLQGADLSPLGDLNITNRIYIRDSDIDGTTTKIPSTAPMCQPAKAARWAGTSYIAANLSQAEACACTDANADGACD